MRSLILLAALAVGGGSRAPAGWPSAAAAQASHPKTVAPWDSTPLVKVADIDSTGSPCKDFYQYATGGWYRRNPMAIADSVEVVGPNLRVIGNALRQYVVAAPALVPTTTDPATRLLGEFYGSCLVDAGGTAEGAVGDVARANYCFRKTRDALDIALAGVLLDRVWPADARAESRTLWTSMTQAAARRIRSSSVLRDSTKRRLADVVATTELVMGDEPSVPFLPFLDSIAPEWDRVSQREDGRVQLDLTAEQGRVFDRLMGAWMRQYLPGD